MKGTGAITEAKVHCRICAMAHEVLRGYRLDSKKSNGQLYHLYALSRKEFILIRVHINLVSYVLNTE